MKTEKMRAAFETWWRSEMNLAQMDLDRREYPMQKPDFEQPYSSLETERAWLSWQASRETIEVELPAEIDREYFNDESMAGGYNHAVDDCRDIIESLGLRVKA